MNYYNTDYQKELLTLLSNPRKWLGKEKKIRYEVVNEAIRHSNYLFNLLPLPEQIKVNNMNKTCQGGNIKNVRTRQDGEMLLFGMFLPHELNNEKDVLSNLLLCLNNKIDFMSRIIEGPIATPSGEKARRRWRKLYNIFKTGFLNRRAPGGSELAAAAGAVAGLTPSGSEVEEGGLLPPQGGALGSTQGDGLYVSPSSSEGGSPPGSLTSNPGLSAAILATANAMRAVEPQLQLPPDFDSQLRAALLEKARIEAAIEEVQRAIQNIQFRPLTSESSGERNALLSMQTELQAALSSSNRIIDDINRSALSSTVVASPLGRQGAQLPPPSSQQQPLAGIRPPSGSWNAANRSVVVSPLGVSQQQPLAGIRPPSGSWNVANTSLAVSPLGGAVAVSDNPLAVGAQGPFTLAELKAFALTQGYTTVGGGENQTWEGPDGVQLSATDSNTLLRTLSRDLVDADGKLKPSELVARRKYLKYKNKYLKLKEMYNM